MYTRTRLDLAVILSHKISLRGPTLPDTSMVCTRDTASESSFPLSSGKGEKAGRATDRFAQSEAMVQIRKGITLQPALRRQISLLMLEIWFHHDLP